MADSIVHLHNHTSYSLLDGASKVDALVDAAVADGQPALAITDHGNLYGLIDFYRSCKAQDVNPVLGIESYFCDDQAERGKKVGGDSELDGTDKRYYHLTVLAENNVGYQNLIKLSSDAYMEGFYYKPRTSWDKLAQFSDGLIVTSGCLGGPVLQELLHDRFDQGLAKAARLQEIFGKDNFFIELQDHGLVEQKRTNPQLIEISRRLGAPTVVANDSHYVHHDDHVMHDSLLCQPAGSMIKLVSIPERKGVSRGSTRAISNFEKPIEEVIAGDRVLSWSNKDRRGTFHTSGSVVTAVGKRQYDGKLISVEANGKSSSYTHDHICVARLDAELIDGNYVVYMMRRGHSYRIGVTQYRRVLSKARPGGGTLGLVSRCQEEGADAIWALSVWPDLESAREEEAWVSQIYNIPTWTFPEPPRGQVRSAFYSNLWERLGDLTSKAKACLVNHGRDIAYPFWDVLNGEQPTQRRPVNIRACNLMSGMLFCLPEDGTRYTNHGSGVWHVGNVSVSDYVGTVYSLDVADDHTYVSDGILTHNCLQTGARIADEKRFRFKSDQHYLKSAEEMRYLFREVPAACDNTLLIGERANVTIDFDKLHLPVYTPPEGYESPIQYLTALSSKGLQKRYGDRLTDQHYERLSYELGVIDSLGLASYFLIVWDLVKFADREGIRRGAARGSVAGSLVAYCMNISKVDPIRHDLIFERFLNPSRIAMPDIDLDFDTRYRDTLINYTFDKYGRDRVAQIITFSLIKARSAVRDAGRILGYDPPIANKISKAMPGLVMGESTPLAACFEHNARYEIGYNNAAGLRQMYAADPTVKEIVDVALGLEGLVRQDSVHAAAVVIAPGPLTDYVPIQRKPDPDSPTGLGPIVTQYEKNTIEDLGLLKMDYLGLRNLDVISECIKLIGYDPGVDHTTFDDEKTFELLRRGDTVGVFQLESKPMRNLLIRMQPTSIDDIAAVVALYRPGPMGSNMHYDYADRKAGRKMIEYFHEDAKEILDRTLGLMVYQEQVMLIAQRFAGYTMVDADGLRKIIGKKLIDKMATERNKFVNGCLANNYPEQLAVELFESIESFAAYAFNASHAYGYAYISYQTAFLKANFPQEYMTALCSSVASKIEKSAVFLSEARKMGIEVHTPDVNRSDVFFSSREEGIRVGLAAVKNIGPDFSSAILSERRKGPFKSLIDFVERVNPNAGQVESLALSGAFDQWGTRLGISSVSSDVLSLARKAKKKVIDGQTSMFDSDDLWTFAIPDSEFPERMKMEKEREAIGIFVSGHPVESYEQTEYRLNDLESFHEGDEIDVFCLIDKIIPKVTRAGPEMGILTLSDETGVYDEIPCFPKAWARFRPVEGDVGVVSLKIGVNYEGERTYILNDFKRLNVGQEDVSMAKMRIYLPQGFGSDDAAISKLKGVLLSHYGNDNILLQVSKSTLLQLPDDIKVSVTDDLIDDLRVLFKDFSSR